MCPTLLWMELFRHSSDVCNKSVNHAGYKATCLGHINLRVVHIGPANGYTSRAKLQDQVSPKSLLVDASSV
jgi:hypothetical protein